MNFYPRSPRGERHPAVVHTIDPAKNFYPRSPRGERPAGDRRFQWAGEFLSTLPAWGAT